MAKTWFKNTDKRYAAAFILVHWIMAIAIVFLFILGLWMVTLDYYSEWYRTAPDIHRATGILIGFMLVGRLIYRLVSPPPAHESKNRVEHLAITSVHLFFYLLIAVTVLSGYLISTADGREVSVFGLFSIPATITSIHQQEQIFGDIHLYTAYILVGIALVHALAALKHHFINRDNTLKKMLGIK